jgi:aminoglycoside 2''-phosphotransferase
LDINKVVPIQEGWDFFVLEVNQNWIFRFPRRKEGVTQLKREIHFLTKWSNQLPLSVPCYKWIYFENTPSFAAYPKLPGHPLDSQYLSKNIGTLSSELGSFLSALHKIPISFPSLEIHR